MRFRSVAISVTLSDLQRPKWPLFIFILFTDACHICRGAASTSTAQCTCQQRQQQPQQQHQQVKVSFCVIVTGWDSYLCQGLLFSKLTYLLTLSVFGVGSTVGARRGVHSMSVHRLHLSVCLWHTHIYYTKVSLLLTYYLFTYLLTYLFTYLWV